MNKQEAISTLKTLKSVLEVTIRRSDDSTRKGSHFDTWLKIARNLGHFWGSFDDSSIALAKSAFLISGWKSARDVLMVFMDTHPHLPSYKKLGGILPPVCTDYEHWTATRRLKIMVDDEGQAHVEIWRRNKRVAVFRFESGCIVKTWAMTQQKWEEYCDRYECPVDPVLGDRHIFAVNDALGNEGHRNIDAVRGLLSPEAIKRWDAYQADSFGDDGLQP